VPCCSALFRCLALCCIERLTAGLPFGVGPADIDLETSGARHKYKLLASRGLNGTGGSWFLHGWILAGTLCPPLQPEAKNSVVGLEFV
jgi:hypothetical protein